MSDRLRDGMTACLQAALCDAATQRHGIAERSAASFESRRLGEGEEADGAASIAFDV